MSVIWQQQTHGVPRRRSKMNRSVAQLFLLILLLAALLAALYLWLMASKVQLSRQVWAMENELVALERENRLLHAEIAETGSIPRLQERSVALGYQPAGAVDYLYIGAP